MVHRKRIAAAALVVGAILGAGALPASAAERADDRGHHSSYDHGRDYRADGWHHNHGHHYGRDHRGNGWLHNHGNHFWR